MKMMVCLCTAQGRWRITRMEPIESSTVRLGETIVSAKIDVSALIEGSAMNALLRHTWVWHKGRVNGGSWRVT